MDYSQIQVMDILFKSRFAVDTNTGLPISTAYTLYADGQGGIGWISPLGSLSTYGALISTNTLANLPATLESTNTAVTEMSTFIYTTIESTFTSIISSYSVFEPQVSRNQLNSTVIGLGRAGYLSTPAIVELSTNVEFLLSTNASLSTSIDSLIAFSSSYESAANSTLSTYTGAILVPALANLGATPPGGDPGNAFVSTFTLNSSIAGISSIGYIQNSQLQSTVTNLGRIGYISSTQLDSTVTSLLSSVNVRITIENTLGLVTIRDSVVNFSSGTNLIYLSTLYLSSVAYAGTTGATGTVANNKDIRFSSLLFPLSNFMPYITSNSRIFLDYYPTFLFTKLSPNALTIPVLTMNTTVIQGVSAVPVGTTSHQAYLVPNLATTTSGFNAVQMDCYNTYVTPMRIPLDTAALSNLSTPISLFHILVNGWSSPGNTDALHNSTVLVQTAPQNTVFLTIHNPPY